MRWPWEDTGKRQDTDICGKMTPSVHFQEASVLVGAKLWKNIMVQNLN